MPDTYSQNSFSFWRKWLFASGMVVIVFGILMALFSGTFLFQIMNDNVNPVFWGGEPLDAGAEKFQKFVYGVLGATMAGWGVFIVFIVQRPFANREKWAWRCLSIGLVLWYALDTSISAWFGVWFNVALNTVFLAAFVVPLLLTRKAFK